MVDADGAAVAGARVAMMWDGAAKALGEIAEPGMLYGIVQRINAEKDEEVRRR